MKQPKPALDSSKEFEEALSARRQSANYTLRLFVTGSTPRSVRAIRNIRKLLEEELRGRYELTVIDVYQHPEQAGSEQIVVTPTLVKKLPLPLRRIIGDLSNRERVLSGLDIIARGGEQDAPEDPHGD